MATIRFKGFDEYEMRLSNLEKNSEGLIGKAIYVGAKVVADSVKNKIQSLPAVPESSNIQAYSSGEKSHLSVKQKKGLIDSFGITPMQVDSKGFYNVKIGFDGYNEIKTKKYPKGQPNQMIARTLESGSSYMDKIPFMRQAINASRAKAVEEMKQAVDEELKEIME